MTSSDVLEEKTLPYGNISILPRGTGNHATVEHTHEENSNTAVVVSNSNRTGTVEVGNLPTQQPTLFPNAVNFSLDEPATPDSEGLVTASNKLVHDDHHIIVPRRPINVAGPMMSQLIGDIITRDSTVELSGRMQRNIDAGKSMKEKILKVQGTFIRYHCFPQMLQSWT